MSDVLDFMPLVCKPACSCARPSAHHAVSHGGMSAHSGRRLWCHFSLIRGLFSDLLPGQAQKEVTSSKVCLSGGDMWMCWHEAPLPAFYTTTAQLPCQTSNCACFLSSRFLLLFPKMHCCARENRLIVWFQSTAPC